MYEFNFIGCVEIKELLGKKADDELTLFEFIEEVPIDSIYYHMHSYFLRHYYLAGQYPNDFANWAALQVRDRVLGEKLASIIPSGNKDLEGIRGNILDVIDRHLVSLKSVPSAISGEPFYFMKSRIIEIPLNIQAKDMEGFIEKLRMVDASSIYYHTYEARLRTPRGKNDFSMWIKEVLKMPHVAEKIEKIDCYMYSLEDLRSKIIDICAKESKT
ncbi:MAG: DUF5752 family protein [Candidatus Omnitrophota bacterium]